MRASYSFAAHAVRVRVDPETGKVEILRYIAAHDVGRAINPLLLQGQIYGALARRFPRQVARILIRDVSGDSPEAPSKTRRKHDMHALQDLGLALAELDPGRLATLGLPERLVDAIALLRKITKHEARRRQVQYIGRLMRDIDPAPLREALKSEGADYFTVELLTQVVPVLKDLDDLARVVKRTMARLDAVIGGAQYNYFLHSVPHDTQRSAHAPSYHWHLEICPRTTIPSGFELGSGLFVNTISPEAAAELTLAYAKGELKVHETEIVDVDEELYRQGELQTRLYSTAKTPHNPALVQERKRIYTSSSEEEFKDQIALFASEFMRDGSAYILGAGTTTAKIAEFLGLEKTLLGVDVVQNGKLILKDAAEKDLLDLLHKVDRAMIIVSPIGAQGFILGRGSQQRRARPVGSFTSSQTHPGHAHGASLDEIPTVHFIGFHGRLLSPLRRGD